MFKYFIWVIKLIIPLLYNYFTWIVRYARNPKKYPLEVRYQKVRKLVLKFFRIIKVDLIVKNSDYVQKDRIYYLVGNHISFLDPIVIIALNERPVSFVSKTETKTFPFVGKIIKIIDGVFIERDNLKQEIKVLQAVRSSLNARDKSWSVFPEGTRSKGYKDQLAEFKAGSFKLPLAAKTDIVPFAIWGSQVPLKSNITWKRYPILVEFYEPIVSELYQENTTVLASYMQDVVQKGVNKLRSEFPQYIQKYIKKKHEKFFN